RVNDEGNLLSIDGTHYIPEKQGRHTPKPIPKNFHLPRERPVTSGDRAFLLFNKAEYVFGKDPNQEREPEKLEKRFALFRARVKQCLDATNDLGVRSVYTLLEDIANSRQQVALPA